DFDHQFRTQRFPRQVLALAPSALAAGHALRAFSQTNINFGPGPPRVIDQSLSAIGVEKLCQLEALRIAETGAHSHMLERARIIKQSEEQGTDQGAIALFMPAKTGNYAVAIALMLDLEHHTFIRLVSPVDRFRHDAVEARALEAPKPILGNRPLPGGGSEV